MKRTTSQLPPSHLKFWNSLLKNGKDNFELEKQLNIGREHKKSVKPFWTILTLSQLNESRVVSFENNTFKGLFLIIIFLQ